MQNIAEIKEVIYESLPLGLDFTFNQLKKFFTAPSKTFDGLVLIEAWYKEIQTKSLSGVISSEEETREYNKIRKAILDLMDKSQEPGLNPNLPNPEKNQYRIKKGKVLYHIPNTMQLGREERCVVRVAIDKEILVEGLENLRNSKIEGTRIAKVMSASLRKANPHHPVSINCVSEEVQFFEEDDYTEWVFYVSAQLPGTYILVLGIAVVSNIEGQEIKRGFTFEKEVQVTAEQIEREKAGREIEEEAFAFYFLMPGNGTGISTEPTSPSGSSFQRKGNILSAWRYPLGIGLLCTLLFGIGEFSSPARGSKMNIAFLPTKTFNIPLPVRNLPERKDKPGKIISSPNSPTPKEDSPADPEPVQKPISVKGFVSSVYPPRMGKGNVPSTGPKRPISKAEIKIFVRDTLIRSIESGQDGYFSLITEQLGKGDSIKLVVGASGHIPKEVILTLADSNNYYLDLDLMIETVPFNGELSWQYSDGVHTNNFASFPARQLAGIFFQDWKGQESYTYTTPVEPTDSSGYLRGDYPRPTDSTNTWFELIKSADTCPNEGEMIKASFSPANYSLQHTEQIKFPLKFLYSSPYGLTIMRKKTWQDRTEIVADKKLSIQLSWKNNEGKRIVLEQKKVRTNENGKLRLAFIFSSLSPEQWMKMDTVYHAEQLALVKAKGQFPIAEDVTLLQMKSIVPNIRMRIRRPFFARDDTYLYISGNDFCAQNLGKKTFVFNKKVWK